MLNRRIERQVQFILFALILLLFMFLIPKVMIEPSKPDISSYIGSALVFSYGIFYCYLRTRNAVYHASWLYNKNLEFFKLFSSFILMNAYESLGEMEKSIIYKNMYMTNPINFSEFR